MMKALKKTLRILAVILAVVLSIIIIYILLDLIVGAILTGSNVDFYKDVGEVAGISVTVEQGDDGITTFKTDEDFRILVLSDTHIGGGAISGDEDAFALRAIEKIVRAEKPHLVALTGDIVYNRIWQTGNQDNKKSLAMVANLFESLKVYWAPIFGNHDSEEGGKYTRAELGEYLESDSLKYCLFKTGDTGGVGNYLINVVSSSDVITQTLVFMDTNAYPAEPTEGYTYDNIHPDQITWYENQLAAQNAKNAAKGEAAPQSLLFVHIPFVEYADAYEKGSIKYGEKRETIWYGINYGMFDSVKKMGTQAIFCGHDHVNNYAAVYEGVQLSYAMSIDYLAYMYTKFYNPARGGTRITISPDGSFKSELSFLSDI